MNILIIEDEIKTSEELREMLTRIDSRCIIKDVVSSVITAIKWLQTNPEPDLIISDIHLSDGMSFDIFSQLIVSSPVIFVTAYDQYAIKAFDVNSIDYLLKPVEEQKLKKAILKYQVLGSYSRIPADYFNKQLVKFASKMAVEYKNSILVYQNEKILPINSAQIQYIFANNGRVTIRSLDKDHVTHYNMEQLESYLNPRQFFRANRQYIINKAQVLNVEHYFNRRLIIKLDCKVPEKIIISKEKANDFLNWLEQ
jgi:two-component system response regulator LytT